MSKVEGGFTTIGIVCSVDNKCTRLVNQSNQYCSQQNVCIIAGAEPTPISNTAG